MIEYFDVLLSNLEALITKISQLFTSRIKNVRNASETFDSKSVLESNKLTAMSLTEKYKR